MGKGRWVRGIFGTILGGFAGLSLTSSVLPTVIAGLTGDDSFFIRFALSDYAAHAFLLWAVAGWALTRHPSMKMGALIFLLVGAISGAGLGIAALGAGPTVLACSTVASAVYALIGGLMLGRILEGGQAQEAEQEVVSATK